MVLNLWARKPWWCFINNNQTLNASPVLSIWNAAAVIGMVWARPIGVGRHTAHIGKDWHGTHENRNTGRIV